MTNRMRRYHPVAAGGGDVGLMSAAAATALESIRSGLSTSLLTYNRALPGESTINTNSSDRSTGFYVSQNADFPMEEVDDADVPTGTGKAWTETIPQGFTDGAGNDALHVTALTRGATTTLTISENVNDVIDADYRWGSTGGSGLSVTIKNYNGDILSWLGMPTGGGTGRDSNTTLGMKMVVTGDHTIVLKKNDGTDLDSSGWDALVVGSPAPVVRWFAGGGNTVLTTLPTAQGQTYPPRVLYVRWFVKYAADYKTDTLGMKGLAILPWWRISQDNAQYVPWFGMSPEEGSDGAIYADAANYVADRLNGVDIGASNPYGPIYSPPITRDTWYKMETVILYPATRGDDSTLWCFQDGVLQTMSGSPAGASYSVRQVDAYNGEHYAARFGGLDINVTYGGGGCFPPIPLTRYMGELFVAGGWADDLEKPHHIDVSIDTAGPYHANDIITIRGVLKDGNDDRVDQFPGWATSISTLTPDIVFTGTHGETNTNALTWHEDDIPAFTVPIQLSATLGATTITVTLKRFLNGAFDGTTVTGSVDLTVVA